MYYHSTNKMDGWMDGQYSSVSNYLQSLPVRKF